MFSSMKFLIVFLFFGTVSTAQDSFPKDYFRSPMDIPMSISGSFGELRASHFHTGLDFRTEKREGIPVFASADGFISRIKISTGGYGKSIYIDHPNGFTTVYAHLQTANGLIQEYIIKESYAQKKYEIELFPKPTELIVKKGDLIGYSGNTGSSGGPHLHFEFRETKTEKIINPLLFGFDSKLKDTKTPQVLGLVAYPINENSQVNGSQLPVFIGLSLQKDGTYLASKVFASGNIGFGINTHDTSDFNYGRNGIYQLDTFMNGMPYFGYKFDIFSFDEGKYINTFIDYSKYNSQKQRFQKLFYGKYNPDNIIKYKKNDGIINLLSNLSFNYKIVVQDFHGNKIVVNVPISFSKMPITQPRNNSKTPYFVKAFNEHSYKKDNISVAFPENTFFDDFYLKFDVKNNELYLHDKSVAVQNSFSITFDVTDVPENQREKMFIANLDDGVADYNNTVKKENLFTINTKKLGKFFLYKDEENPKIYKPSFENESNLDDKNSFKIFISDNLSGIKEYNAYLNGNWILMEYENKLNRLTHNLNDKIYQIGNNEFKLIVTDNLGNTTTFESNFTKTK